MTRALLLSLMVLAAPAGAQAPKPMTAQGVLHAIEDGEALLRVAVSKADLPVLLGRGFRMVKSAAEIADRTILGTDLYVSYSLGPKVDPAALEAAVGHPVRLEIERTPDARMWIVGFGKRAKGP